MNNPFEQALRKAGGMANNVGQAMPVIGGEMMKVAGRGLNNLNPFKGKKKPMVTQPPQPVPPKYSNIRDEQNQLNEINKLTK